MKPLALSLARSERDRQKARALEARVFARYFGNSPDELSAAYDGLQDVTHFIVVKNRISGAVVGQMRVVAASTAQNKTLCEVAGAPWRADAAGIAEKLGFGQVGVWDVATSDRLPRLVRTEVALALYHGLWMLSALNRARFWTAMLDDRVLARLQRAGINFRLLPGVRPAPYFGSASTSPVFVSVEDAHIGVAANEALYVRLARGRRLLTVRAGPADGWLLAASAGP